MTRDLDNNTTIELDTLLSTLDDFVSDCDSITCLELRELLLGCKCFFSNFNQIHFCIKLKIVCRSNATWTWTTLLPRQQRLRRKAGAKLLLFSCISQIFRHFLHFFPLFLFSLLLQWNFLADFADFVDLFCIFAL